MVLRRDAKDGGQGGTQKRCKGWKSEEMQGVEIRMVLRRELSVLHLTFIKRKLLRETSSSKQEP